MSYNENLEALFIKKCILITNKEQKNRQKWIDYLDNLDGVKNLSGIIDYDQLPYNYIVIHDVAYTCNLSIRPDHILVEKELADKILVLGCLP